ncbi:MAG: YccF domain-containing protein [Sulfurovaceae bacterium]|nr:YccF domain-containing protein [Sulfurovaceae bacterium]MDD5548588.1 YccF domain-containing protein [Sulfurovaceae bacterium]
MRLLGNILWHIPFLGFLNAIASYLLGLLLTITVVAAPIGLGLMEYGKFLFAPFSYSMVSKSDLNMDQNILWQSYSILVMIIYLPIGLILAIVGFFQAISLACTIVGIPVAIVVIKSLGTYLNPVGKVCVPVIVVEELDRKKAQDEIDKYTK